MNRRALLITLIIACLATPLVVWTLLRLAHPQSPTTVDGDFPTPAGPIQFHAEFFGDHYNVVNSRPDRIASAEPYLELLERWKHAATVGARKALATPASPANAQRWDKEVQLTLEYRQTHPTPSPTNLRVYLTVSTDGPSGKWLYIASSHTADAWEAEDRTHNHVEVQAIRWTESGYKFNADGGIDEINRELQRGKWKQFGAQRDIVRQ